MTTVFNIEHWNNRVEVAKWFHARLDHHPCYSTGTRCYFPNWLEDVHGDSSKWRNNNHGNILLPTNSVELRTNSIVLKTIPLDKPIQMPEDELTFLGGCMVGNFFINTGRLTVEATFSGNLRNTEALWFSTVPHYDSKAESLLPEYDGWETNTPMNEGKMSSSTITSYNPIIARNIYKMPLAPYAGVRRKYIITVEPRCITYKSDIDNRRIFRLSRLPIFPIFWNVVQKHHSYIQPYSTEFIIHSVKFEA